MSSVGNTNRDLRRFCRENGVPPTIANIERIGREVRRTESQNERVVRESKERGGPSTQYVSRDGRVHGDVLKTRREYVQRDIAARPEPKRRR